MLPPQVNRSLYTYFRKTARASFIHLADRMGFTLDSCNIYMPPIPSYECYSYLAALKADKKVCSLEEITEEKFHLRKNE